MTDRPQESETPTEAQNGATKRPGSGDTSLIAQVSPGGGSTTPFGKLPAEFGRYRVEKLLGSGAMGAVYLATDSLLDRRVALKIPRLSKSSSQGLLRRMEREAKALAQLSHPNICKVYDFDIIDGVRFIALEYVEGETLKSLLKRLGRKRKVSDAVQMVTQLARALGVAHEKNVIHRDLKPENIMRRPDGRLVIMDFGLNRQSRLGEDEADRTQNGVILGTPAYMSPEQAAGRLDEVDQRSDIYSLGVMLYEMLTGELPFSGTPMEVMGRKTVQAAPSPSSVDPRLPLSLAALCDRMLARKREDRFETSAEVAKALKDCDLTPAPVWADKASDRETAGPETVSVDPLDFLRDPEFTPAAPPPQPKEAMSSGPVSRPSGPGFVARLAASAAAWWRAQPRSMQISLAGVAMVVLAILGMILRQEFRAAKAIEPGESDPAVAVVAQEGVLQPAANPVTPEVEPSTTVAASANSTVPVVVGTKGGDSRTFSSLKIRMSWCPPGTFPMGIADPKTPEFNHGKLFETVTLTSGFWIGSTEVTQSQWAAVMKTRPWQGKSGTIEGDNVAASFIDFNDALQFCSTLTRLEREAGQLENGWSYTLPSSAQWEYACRAGTETRFYFGSDERLASDYGWWGGQTGQGNVAGAMYAHVVGQKLANAWGLYDTFGNVSEWCADAFSSKLSGGTDPLRRNPSSQIRQFCGGNYAAPILYCGSGSRMGAVATMKNGIVGFRITLQKSEDDAPSGNPGSTVPAEGLSFLNGENRDAWFSVVNSHSQKAVSAGQNGQGELRLVQRNLSAGGDLTQHWRFEVVDPAAGTVLLRNRAYDRVAAPAGPVEMTLQPQTPQSPPTWKVEIAPGGIRLQHLSGNYLAVGGSSVEEGASVIHYPRLEINDQTWIVRPVTGGTEDPSVTKPPALTSPINRRAQIMGQRGAWRIEGEELVQGDPKARFSYLFFGDENWTDYDFRFEARRTEGVPGVKAIFRGTNPGNTVLFGLGSAGNTVHDLICYVREPNGQMAYPVNRIKRGSIGDDWIRLRVEVRGNSCKCFANDELVLQHDGTQQLIARGRVGVETYDSAVRCRNFRVTAPDGTLLWEGLPELP